VIIFFTACRFESSDALFLNVQVLAGEEAVFAELRHILGTWYCMLISVLLYTNPAVQATDLQYHAHVSKNLKQLLKCRLLFILIVLVFDVQKLIVVSESTLYKDLLIYPKDGQKWPLVDITLQIEQIFNITYILWLVVCICVRNKLIYNIKFIPFQRHCSGILVSDCKTDGFILHVCVL